MVLVMFVAVYYALGMITVTVEIKLKHLLLDCLGIPSRKVKVMHSTTENKVMVYVLVAG